jgi:anti-sigma regulatory factor (Ser/Thr protein kinase)
MPRQSWTVPAEAREVARLRSAVVSFAAEHGVQEPPIGDLKIAISEAMTNVIVHAYNGRDRGEIHISVSVDLRSREMTVVVADEGSGMNPRPDSPGMGLGLPLIGNLASNLRVSSAPGGLGTEVRMRFELPVGDAGSPCAVGTSSS